MKKKTNEIKVLDEDENIIALYDAGIIEELSNRLTTVQINKIKEYLHYQWQIKEGIIYYDEEDETNNKMDGIHWFIWTAAYQLMIEKKKKSEKKRKRRQEKDLRKSN